MTVTRRDMLAACAAAVPALCGVPSPARAAERKRLGVVLYSYAIRSGSERGFRDPLVFVEHCHRLGAGGVQLDLGVRDEAYLVRLRDKLAAYQMYMEGTVRVPQDRADRERFTAAVQTAKQAGASVLRTVLTGGRRYEAFATAAAFRKAVEQAEQSLALAEPIVARHGMRLAIENHKDFRADELVGLLKRRDRRHVGVCVDTGNSIALLEDPLEVVEALAPLAHSTHLKDMAVAEYADGFLLAEVPLGEGMLDLKKIVATLRRARPEVQFNLEMITRDPLKVPCLAPGYWATLENLPGRHLARTLALVRKRAPRQPLPRISGLGKEQQVATEEENVRRSLAYAAAHLEL
jgi:sugar phosphate isomerase/epimerase